ncbi:periphilin-1-like [Cavia porcellus]|uniref:periphilin-1-like n=1 Tax=Cavia porcellus TaxID=10141 RepID=UPI002FDFCC1B
MWSNGPHDHQRLSRKRRQPQSLPRERYLSIFNNVPRQPPQLGSQRPLRKTPPLCGEKARLLDSPGEGSSFACHQEYDKGLTSAPVQRSVQPQKGDEAGNQWSRYNPSASPQSYNRDERESWTRQSFYASKYTKDQSPHTKIPTFFGESLSGQEASPVTTSSKVLEDKSSRLTEKELCEAVRAWAAQTSEASQESGISEFEEELTRQLFRKHPVPPPADAEDSTEGSEDSQLGSSFKSIDSKVKEIEDLYQLYSETYGMVVRQLIEKDPSLERPIQFSLSQNLQEIGDKLLKDLKDFIAEYHASQDNRKVFLGAIVVRQKENPFYCCNLKILNKVVIKTECKPIKADVTKVPGSVSSESGGGEAQAAEPEAPGVCTVYTGGQKT